MSDNTHIEWTDATVNAVNGCSVLSPGCRHCYAMRLAGTRLKHHPSRAGLTIDSKAKNGKQGHPVWTGEVRLNETALLQPLKWKRPRKIFWNAHGDLFHEAVPDEWIDRVFAICALTPQHTHQILTKRPERMREYCTALAEGGRYVDSEIWRITAPLPDGGYNTALCRNDHARTVVKGMTGSPGHPTWVLPNVWLGTSVEDQTRADERIPHLLATPAAVRFLSCEPLLGPVDLEFIEYYPGFYLNAFTGRDPEGHCPDTPGLNWVIVGGESGPGARPMHPDWARQLRDQCAAAVVPFFFKQWGEYAPYDGGARDGAWFDPDGHFYGGPTNWPPHDNEHRCFMCRVGKKAAGRLLDGVEHNGMPA